MEKKAATVTLVNDYIAEFIIFHAADRPDVGMHDNLDTGWRYTLLRAPVPDALALEILEGEQDAQTVELREFLRRQVGAILSEVPNGYTWVRTYEDEDEIAEEWEAILRGEDED